MVQVIEIEDTRRRNRVVFKRNARNGEKMKNSFLVIMSLSYL